MNPDEPRREPDLDDAATAAPETSEFRASVRHARERVSAFLVADAATKRRLLGDAVALLPLAAVLLWMAAHDGGYEPLFRRYASVVVLAGSPLAILELPALDPWPRRLLAWWGLGLLAVWALAGERNYWVTSSIPLLLAPMVGLYAHRIWRRPWGPTALFALLLLTAGAYFYRAFLAWWGDTLVGRQPLFRPLSWHNQSGALMGALGAAFLGAALAARSSVAVIAGAASAATLGAAWLAGSRGAFAAAMVGVVVVVVAALRGGGGARRVLGLTALVGIGAVVVLLALVSMDPVPDGDRAGVPRSIPSERITDRNQPANISFSRRLLHMEAAAGMFLDRPVRGEGIGSYRIQSLDHTDPDARLTSSAHNEYLEVLGEGGLLFGVAFLALHALIGVAALRRRIDRSATDDPDDLRPVVAAAGIGLVVVIGLHAAVDFDWFYPVLPALLAIGAVAVGGRAATPEAVRAAPRRLALLGVPLALALALVVAADFAEARANAGREELSAEELAAVPLPWQGERALPLALDLARAGEDELAIAVMRDALAWNPAVDDYAVLLDTFRYRAGEVDAEALVTSLADHDAQFRVFNLVAEALIDEGDLRLARGVLGVALDRYDEYRNWGVGGVRAESWYLVVRADVEAGACDAARQDADEAVASGAYDPDQAERELAPLVASCDPGSGVAGLREGRFPSASRVPARQARAPDEGEPCVATAVAVAR